MSTYILGRTAIKAVINMPHAQLQRKFDRVTLNTFFGERISIKDGSLSALLELFDGDMEIIESIQLTNFDESIDPIVISDITVLFPAAPKITTVPNINKKALKLAHSLKGVYSSFRVALRMAYKLLKSSRERERVLDALITVMIATFNLGMAKKSQAALDAWFAIWNLDYLD